MKSKKGDIFEYGKNITPFKYTLSTIDTSKPAPDTSKDAPLHNLGAERSAGFINYELDRSVARPHLLKWESQDLIEKSPPGLFRCYEHHTKPGSRMTDLKLEWCQK